VYIPARDIGWVHTQAGDKWFDLGVDNIDALSEGQKVPETGGYLKAWDPVKQELVWQMKMANIWNGGVLATNGGLVFHGTATGNLYALDDATGEVLLDLPLGTGIIAPPISYSIEGEQYIALMAGWGGPAFNTLNGDEALFKYGNAGRVLVFKLNGSKVEIPTQVAEPTPFSAPEGYPTSEQLIAQGKELYVIQCGGCHGLHGSIPMLPDLRRTSPEKHKLFQQIVRGGILESLGMSSFADDLSEQQVTAIQAYVISEARAAKLAVK
jgi:quinohemoprotein ethanol dehydrogenase